MPFAYRTKLPRGGSSQWVSGGAAPVLNAEFFGVAAPAPATAIDVIQLAPLVEEYPVPTTTTSFPADLTAGNDVWVALKADNTSSFTLLLQGVPGTLMFSETRSVVTGTFYYYYYVWRNVSAGPGTVSIQIPSTVNMYALETTPGGTLGPTFFETTNEFDAPLPNAAPGSLAIAFLRSDNSDGVAGIAPTFSTAPTFGNPWNYGLYEELPNASGNTLQWTKTSGAYRAVVGIIVEPPASPPPSVSLNYWNGTAFVPGVLKRWNGTAWVTHTLKRWNGTAWV